MPSAESPITGKTRILDRSINRVPPGDLTPVMPGRNGPRSEVALFCNVHMLMLSQSDAALAQAMDEADWVFADGVPVAWLQRRLSGLGNRVVRGYEMMLAICEEASRNKLRVGLFGSSVQTLDSLQRELESRFPGLQLTFKSSPPFTIGDLVSTEAELQAINVAELDWLFVGLGCPKQEKWIHRYAPHLDCSLLGVGAAFDWLAGTVPKPPRWMEKSGLGWLYRLLHNPGRMWRRYLIYNTKFLVAVTRLLIWDKVTGTSAADDVP